jgi:hypothetical protein
MVIGLTDDVLHVLSWEKDTTYNLQSAVIQVLDMYFILHVQPGASPEAGEHQRGESKRIFVLFHA